MRRAALAGLILLQACATPSAPTPGPVAVCPARRHYTPAEERAIGQAIASLPPASPLVGAMIDYTALLKQVEACEKS